MAGLCSGWGCGAVPSPELEETQTLLYALDRELNDHLLRLYYQGREQYDHLLQGQALLGRARYLFTMEMDLYSQWSMLKHLRSHDERIYLENIRMTFSGYQHLLDGGYPEQAYQCLFYTIELIQIGRQVYRYRDGFNVEELEELRRRMEEENEIAPGSPQFFALVEKLSRSEAEEDRRYFSDTIDKDDQQLAAMARSYSRAFGLPPACLPNILGELQKCRLFYSRAGGDLDLLPYDRSDDRREVYLRPVRFVIRYTRTNIHSMPASDLAELLTSWGY